MRRLLRFALFVVGVLCVLLALVTWLGARLPISTDILYITYTEEDYLYHPYLVDMRYGLQVDLASTDCETGPPSWAAGGYPDHDPIVMYDSDGIHIVYDPPAGERCKL